MADDYEDDIDLGEDFDFDDDIPEEDVDIDGPPEAEAGDSDGGSSAAAPASTSVKKRGGIAKNLVKLVVGISSFAILAGGGYLAYDIILGDPALERQIASADDFLDGKAPKHNSYHVTPTEQNGGSTGSSGKVSVANFKNNSSSKQDDDVKKFNKLSFDDLMETDSKDVAQVETATKQLNETTSMSSSEASDLKDTLNGVAIELSSNINHVRSLEKVVKDMSRIVVSLDKTIKQIDNRVEGLAETVDGVTSSFNSVKSQMKDVQASIKKVNKFVKDEDLDLGPDAAENTKIVYTAPEFVVHAIIPGRAWLKSSAGKVITVTEGYNLGKYGDVAVIDTGNGTVVTSSGVTFR